MAEANKTQGGRVLSKLQSTGSAPPQQSGEAGGKEMSTDQRPLVIGTTRLMGKHMDFLAAAKGIPFKSVSLP